MQLKLKQFIYFCFILCFILLPNYVSARENIDSNLEIESAATEPSKKNKPLFYINPGLIASHYQLDLLNSLNEERASIAPNHVRTILYLDVSSTNIQLSNEFGVHFFWNASSIYLNRQMNFDENQLSNFNFFENESVLKNKPFRDMGSRLRGYYSYFVPAFYYGEEKLSSHRTGIGLGIGAMKYIGTINLSSKQNDLIYLNALSDRNRTGDKYLPFIFFQNYVLVEKTDPVEMNIISKIGQNDDALDFLGKYWIVNDRVSLQKNDMLFYILTNSGRSIFETIALRGLSFQSVNVGPERIMPVVLYHEFPGTGGFKIRLFTATMSSQKYPFNIDFTSVNAALYYPIPVSRPKWLK